MNEMFEKTRIAVFDSNKMVNELHDYMLDNFSKLQANIIAMIDELLADHGFYNHCAIYGQVVPVVFDKFYVNINEIDTHASIYEYHSFLGPESINKCFLYFTYADERDTNYVGGLVNSKYRIIEITPGFFENTDKFVNEVLEETKTKLNELIVKKNKESTRHRKMIKFLASNNIVKSQDNLDELANDILKFVDSL